MAARKRSKSKARTGTAGKKKTALRKSPATKARTKTTGRVKGARGGPAHPENKPDAPTKRASSRRRAAETGEPISGKRGSGSRIAPPDLTEGDVKKIPGMARVRAMETGENTVTGKKRTRKK
ncbi:MAG TPA: hypothetical protein VGC96_12935 [Candidatus Elarobacter sp.]|jgi:hypothetical protein